MTHWPGTYALIAPRYSPGIGGVERYVERIAQGFVQRGLRVEVITLNHTGRLSADEEIDGVRVRRFPAVANNQTYFVSPDIGVWLLKHARDYVILHAQSYHTPVALQAAFAARWHQIPFVVTPHYHGTGHSPLRRLLHIPYRLPGAWMLKQAAQIFCDSNIEMAHLKQDFGANLPVSVLPCGIDVEEITSAVPLDKSAGKVRMISVGRLEAYKQVDKLIRAMPFLPPNYELIVVGSGPLAVPIRALVGELELGQRVQLMGNVTQAMLFSLYRTADIVVSLSRHEAFGMTILEGAVAGAAVLASDIPAHREVTGYLPTTQTRCISPDSTPFDLAAVIQSIGLADRTQFTIDQLSRSLVPTWDMAVNDLLKHYELILGKSSI